LQVVEWDEVRFDVRLMQRVPYEGVSRMQTSLRRRHRDRVVRRGLALIIESDFYATDAGRQHFADRALHASNFTTVPYTNSRGDCRAQSLPAFGTASRRCAPAAARSLPPHPACAACALTRACPLQTCNFDALYAYLSTANYDFSYDRAKNLRPRRNIKTAMNNEIMLYGIAQKEQLGFDKAVEECKYRMSRYGVTPNSALVVAQTRRLLVLLLTVFLPCVRSACPASPNASVHGPRAGAEAHVRHSNLKPSNLQLVE